MTRFARAKGSKSSNERLPEEATSWTDMKEQLLNKQREASEAENRNAMNAKRLENFNNFINDERNKDSAKTEWADFSNVRTITDGNNKKPSAGNKVHNKRRKSNGDNNIPSADNKVENKKRKSNADNNIPSADNKVENKKIKSNGDNNTPSPDNKVEKKKVKKRRSEGDDNNNKETKVQVNVTEMTEEERNKHANKLAKRKLQKEKRKLLKSNQNGEAEQVKTDTETNQAKNKKGKKKPKGIIKPKKPMEELTEKERALVARKQARRQRQLEKRKLLKEKKLAEQEHTNLDAKSFNKPQPKKKPPKDKTGKEAKRKKPAPVGETLHINGRSIDIVYVDGFPVKKEDGERLAELRKTMISKGLPRSEVQAGMKLARRRAEKALAREKRNVCFKCRQSGHNLSECPNLMNEETIASGICFKCGSTEHTHFECKVVKQQEFKFATCFICHEQGHISKQCPDNARGLYPKGGACKLCGDVTHLKKDCPKRIAEQEASTIGLETIGGDIEGLDVKSKIVVHNKPNKIVKFF